NTTAMTSPARFTRLASLILKLYILIRLLAGQILPNAGKQHEPSFDSVSTWCLMRAMCETYGWYAVSGFQFPPIGSNPCGIEGHKTIAVGMGENGDGMGEAGRRARRGGRTHRARRRLWSAAKRSRSWLPASRRTTRPPLPANVAISAQQTPTSKAPSPKTTWSWRSSLPAAGKRAPPPPACRPCPSSINQQRRLAQELRVLGLREDEIRHVGAGNVAAADARDVEQSAVAAGTRAVGKHAGPHDNPPCDPFHDDPFLALFVGVDATEPEGKHQIVKPPIAVSPAVAGTDACHGDQQLFRLERRGQVFRATGEQRGPCNLVSRAQAVAHDILPVDDPSHRGAVPRIALNDAQPLMAHRHPRRHPHEHRHCVTLIQRRLHHFKTDATRRPDDRDVHPHHPWPNGGRGCRRTALAATDPVARPHLVSSGEN